MSKCVHCFQELTKKIRSKDHIFPKSWLPDDTPASLELWTVPSCKECNHGLKMIEEVLFLRWAGGADPNDQLAAKGIEQRAEDQINFMKAKNTRVAEIRARALFRLMKDFKKHDPKITLKGLGPKAGVRGEMAFRSSGKATHRFAEKIIRGLEFKFRSRLVGKDTIIQTYFVHLDEEKMEPYYKQWQQLIATNKFKADLGPGFMVEYGINPDPEYNDQVIYNVKIWGHIEFWGWVYKNRSTEDVTA